MIAKVINILSWFIERWDGAKKWIKETYRVYRSRKVRDAVDSGDKRTIDGVLRDIWEKRKRRTDAS